MLSNAYFLAKFRFDTAENEPAKNLQNFRKMHFRKMHFRKMHFRKMHFRKMHFRKMHLSLWLWRDPVASDEHKIEREPSTEVVFRAHIGVEDK